MIKELVEFYEEIFPSISPYTADEAKKACDQFKNEGRTFSTTMSNCLEDLSQGDIFSEIPFIFIGKDGKQRTIKARAMLLSNTCDCVRNERLQFAAMFKVSDFSDEEGIRESIRHNKYFQCLYLPDNRLDDEFVDFGLICSYDREFFKQIINMGKVVKIASLSQVGYYILLTKLTVYFLRPEDMEVNESRNQK